MRKQKIGRYDVVREIGRGGMGYVLEVYDGMLHRKVALKLLIEDEGFSKEYFLREAQNTAKLRHPNIVAVYDIGEEDGQLFFTMDLIEGTTLQTLLEQKAILEQKCLTLLAKIADAVHYAHQQGIIHRDIKPQNIMVTSEGEPKLMDFGLAKEVKSANISQVGIVVGTPAYMAPEQIEGKAEMRSDIYSLGSILYEMLTGTPPFENETSVHTMMHVLEKDPAPPRKRNPAISREIEAICLKAMAKKVVFRYQSAKELADDLRRYLAGETPLAKPLTNYQKITRWIRKNQMLWMKAFSFVVLCLFLGILGMFFMLTPGSQKVFLLFSYEKDLLWNVHIRETFLLNLQEHYKPGQNLRLEEYYMETKRFSQKEQIEASAKIAIEKIRLFHPHLVIAVDDHASSLVIPAFFNTDIQFIFCGLNNDPAAYHFPQPNVTGIREKILASQTFQNMPYFLPQAKKYVIAIEESLSGRLALAEIEKAIGSHPAYQNLATLISDDFKAWQEFLQKYEASVDFVFIPVYLNLKDEKKNHVPPEKVMQWIVTNIHKPPIGALGFNIEHGALYGVVDTAQKQAELASIYAIQILKDKKKAGDLKMTSISKGELYVNKTTAQKYSIVIPEWMYQFATVFE